MNAKVIWHGPYKPEINNLDLIISLLTCIRNIQLHHSTKMRGSCMSSSSSGCKGRVRKSWQMLSVPFKWDDSILGEGEHTGLPDGYSDVLLTAPFEPSCLPGNYGTPVVCVCVLRPLGRGMRAHTLRCGLSPCSVGLEQPPLLRSSPGWALACPGMQVISVQFPAECSCIPSNEQRVRGSHAAA